MYLSKKRNWCDDSSVVHNELRIFVRCFIFLLHSFLHQPIHMTVFHPAAENSPANCMIDWKPVLISSSSQSSSFYLQIYIPADPYLSFFLQPPSLLIWNQSAIIYYSKFFSTTPSRLSNFYLCIWLSFFLKEEFCNCLLISLHYSNPSGSIWIFILSPKVLDFYPIFCQLQIW